MEAAFVPPKIAVFALKASLMKFGFLQKFYITLGLKAAKASCILLGGMYYNSIVTSFLVNMRPKLPDSINAKINAAKDFVNVSPKIKATLDLKEKPSVPVRKVIDGDETNICGQEFNLQNSESFTSNARKSLSEAFSSSSSDVLEMAIDEVMEFKDEVLDDIVGGTLSGLEKAGLKYLDSTFREKDVHRSLISLINDSFRNRTTINESREYGIQLMNGVVKDHDFIQKTKRLSLDVVNHQDVKQASISLVKNSLNHATTQHYAKVLLTDAVLKTKAMDVMISSLTECVIKAVQKPETNGHLGKLINRTKDNAEVMNEAKNSLIYANLSKRMPLSKKSNSETPYTLSEELEARIDSWIPDRQTL